MLMCLNSIHFIVQNEVGLKLLKIGSILTQTAYT